MAAKSRVAPRNRTEDPFRALQKKADPRQKGQERSCCFARMAFPAQIQRLSRVAEVGSLLARAKMPIKILVKCAFVILRIIAICKFNSVYIECNSVRIA